MYRPQYPDELIDYVTNLCVSKDTAWDCCTGTGIVANMLSRRFKHVIATDISRSQINHAIKKVNIDYRIESAYDGSLSKNSVDLITVAQAFHWLDQGKFYNKIAGNLKADGVLAIWCHGDCSNPDLKSITNKYLSFVSDALPKEEAELFRRNYAYIKSGYAELHMPFQSCNYNIFDMQQHWDMQQYIGYLESISISNLYKERHGQSAIVSVLDDLRGVWRDELDIIDIVWKIHLHTFKN